MDAALDDEPLTLKEACDLIFRNAISPATLRAEADRGRLVIERIGRRDFVTRRAIREMRKKCELAPAQKAPASGSSPSASGRTEVLSPPSGASETTDDSSVALASVLMIAEQLSGNSQSTSPRTTRRNAAKVIPLKP
jgi:hypothetical protein